MEEIGDAVSRTQYWTFWAFTLAFNLLTGGYLYAVGPSPVLCGLALASVATTSEMIAGWQAHRGEQRGAPRCRMYLADWIAHLSGAAGVIVPWLMAGNSPEAVLGAIVPGAFLIAIATARRTRLRWLRQEQERLAAFE